MSNTYSYVYIGFEPTDKIILIYFQGMRIKLKPLPCFYANRFDLFYQDDWLFYFVRKGLNKYENKNKKPNNIICIQKISKEFFNEKIYFYEIYNLKSR